MDLTDEFDAHRDHLRAVAYRMLGSTGDVDDVLQEAWLRLARSGAEVRNTRAWLTTVVARICLDVLRTRALRHEVPLDEPLPGDAPDPENEAVLADSVGVALMVVLDTLTPAERLAFVLHDLFALPFAHIAQVLDRSIPATKMLASRARRRVRTAEARHTDLVRRRTIVEAFLAASRDGDFDALLNLLDPQATVRADATAAPNGVPVEVHGADAVARQASAFAHMTRYARLASIDGEPAITVAPNGRLALVLRFSITASGTIAHIDIVADPQQLAGFDPSTDWTG